MTLDALRIAVVGAGAVGAQRAATAVRHPRTELVTVIDPDEAAAQRLAAQHGVAHGSDWTRMLQNYDPDIVAVCTPHAQLAEVAIESLVAGCHVLAEAPMGRNVTEAVAMAGAATSADRILKIGFNHRYYPALTRAHAYFSEGVIGSIVSIRARYGQGGRPGEPDGWRENRELAAGGQLTDHGLHIIDLVHWFAGAPLEVFSFLQSAVWPIKPLEDSAFALFRFDSGVVASMHTAWTQWQDLFSFEVNGTEGSMTVEGLGGSFGQQKLVVARRRAEGGAPYTETTLFDDDDISWAAEWAELVEAVDAGRPYHGSPHDGVTVMNVLDALYRSAESRQLVAM